jgi:hypothetical protein
MERVHYRRVTNAQRKPESNNNFKEKFVTQAIVSGLILIFTLAVCVFENPFSTEVRNGVQKVFEGYESADELLEEIQQLSAEWFRNEEPVVDDLNAAGLELSAIPGPQYRLNSITR